MVNGEFGNGVVYLGGNDVADIEDILSSCITGVSTVLAVCLRSAFGIYVSSNSNKRW
jgi:hypothetical protein